MKRTALFILACAALIMSGCAKEKKSSGPISTYKIVVDKNVSIVLPDDQSITASFYPRTEDDALNTDITVTFKADPSLISKYTERKDAKLLPESNYLFRTNPVIIEAERRFPISEDDYCKLTLKHTPALEPDAFYVLPIVIESITGNANATFDPNDILFITVKTTRKGAGKGTEEEPFKIETVDHLTTMAEYSVAGKKTWFRLEKDLDFSGVENWDPINLDSDNSFYIDFNGNGKTMSNFKCTDKTGASIFGYVSGNIHDLKIDNAVVTAKNSAVDIAIIANTFGSNEEGETSDCENITITNSKVIADFAPNTDQISQAFIAVNARNATFKKIILDSSNEMQLYFAKSMSAGVGAGGLVAYGKKTCEFIQCGNAVDLCGYNQKQIGGIVGSLLGGRISECWNTGKIEGNEDVAGIAGQFGEKKEGKKDTETWTISDCYNKGQIRCTGQRSGGICGCPFNSVTIERCYNTGDVIAMYRRDETGKEKTDDIDGRDLGGIAGHVCGGSGIWDFTVDNFVTIKDCIVFSKKIQAIALDDAGKVRENRPGAGAIVGYASLKNTYSKCLRSTDTKVDNSQTCIPWDAFDQDDTPPDLGFPSNYPPLEKNRPIPYHGKVTENTLPQAAQSLNWSAGTWNLTDPPSLVNNPEK